MQFKSDEQRKAVFAKLKGGRRGGGGGRRPPRTPGQTPPHPGLQQVINWILNQTDTGTGWQPLPPGQGIPGWQGGSVTLTGGAIYDTPPSNWALHTDDSPPNYGTLPGYGIGPWDQQFTPGWIPPETLAGQIWTILVNGLDADTGQPIPTGPWDPGYFGLLEAEFSAYPGGFETELQTDVPPRNNTNPWNPFE